MEHFHKLIEQYGTIIMAGSLVIAALSFVIVLINYLRTSRILRKYKKLMRGSKTKNLEAMLNDYMKTVEKANEKTDRLEAEYDSILKNLSLSIQNVGVVRYNPFEQVGSDQSFSIALLDGHGNGVVITGLYARGTSTAYAKPIEQMKSKYPLSSEEIQSIERAMKRNIGMTQ
jgi:hypothetical protein